MTPICTFISTSLPLYFSPTCLIFSCSLFSLVCAGSASTTCGHYSGLQGRSPAQTYSLPSSLPVKSSGAIWIGVPTMLPDIMASGLQNPKSVILARFCLSSCQQSRVGVTLCLIPHTALSSAASPRSQAGVRLTAVLNQSCLQPPSPDSFP